MRQDMKIPKETAWSQIKKPTTTGDTTTDGLLGTASTGGAVALVAEVEILPIVVIVLGVAGKAAVTSTTMPGVKVVVVTACGGASDPGAVISVLEAEMFAVVALRKGTVPVVE